MRACNQHYRIPERQSIVVLKATKLNNSKNAWQRPFGKGKVGDWLGGGAPSALLHGVIGFGRPGGNLQVTQGTALAAGPVRRGGGWARGARGAEMCKWRSWTECRRKLQSGHGEGWVSGWGSKGCGLPGALPPRTLAGPGTSRDSGLRSSERAALGRTLGTHRAVGALPGWGPVCPPPPRPARSLVGMCLLSSLQLLPNPTGESPGSERPGTGVPAVSAAGGTGNRRTERAGAGTRGAGTEAEVPRGAATGWGGVSWAGAATGTWECGEGKGPRGWPGGGPCEWCQVTSRFIFIAPCSLRLGVMFGDWEQRYQIAPGLIWGLGIGHSAVQTLIFLKARFVFVLVSIGFSPQLTHFSSF